MHQTPYRKNASFHRSGSRTLKYLPITIVMLIIATTIAARIRAIP